MRHAQDLVQRGRAGLYFLKTVSEERGHPPLDRRLFDGELGFEPVACFRREPRLGHIEIVDDPTESLPFTLPDVCRPQALTQIRLRLDESYVVYDHPRTIVFRRTGPAD